MKKSFNLENLIYLTVFGLPFYLIRFNFFGIPANVLDVLEILVFLWWILDKNNKKPAVREIFTGYKNYLIAIGLIFLGLIISTFSGGEYRLGLGIIKSWFVLPILFLFAVLNILNREKTKNVFKAFFWSAFGVSIIAIIYFFLGLFTYDSRLEGFFNSPNYLAMYLAPGLIMGLGLVQVQSSKFKAQSRTGYFVGCGIILIALYLTHSYAAWVAIVLSLLIVEAVKRKNQILKSKIIWSSLILVILAFYFQGNSEKFRSLYNFSERSSLASRFMIWSSALKIGEDNPIWGIGPGNFQSKYLEYQKFFPPYLEWAVPHPHNLYLAFWLGAGFFGLIGFALLLIFWFKDFFKTEKSDLKIIALGVMVYILIHGLVDTTYFKNDLAVIFWLNFLTLSQKIQPKTEF